MKAKKHSKFKQHDSVQENKQLVFFYSLPDNCIPKSIQLFLFHKKKRACSSFQNNILSCGTNEISEFSIKFPNKKNKKKIVFPKIRLFLIPYFPKFRFSGRTKDVIRIKFFYYFFEKNKNVIEK